MSSLTDGGLLVASNRLPLTLERQPDGTWVREPGSGGLVTALGPVLAKEGGVWVGWPGVLAEEVDDVEALVRDICADEPYRVEPVALTEEERSDFYLGFSNEILWPLCHGFPGRCRFEPRYWRVYRRVNQKFAEAILSASSNSRLVWVHDYHLMAVAEYLRAEGFDKRCGYFHHIPFPPRDIFGHLPWADEVLRSLLDYDLLGFQTNRDRQNFFDCLELLGDDVTAPDEESVIGPSGRRTRVGVFPISVDWQVFHGGALQETVAHRARRFREEFGGNRILIGVDRLDYTKGIPERLAGMERALERFPDLRERITLVQLVVPEPGEHSRVRAHEVRDRGDGGPHQRPLHPRRLGAHRLPLRLAGAT